MITKSYYGTIFAYQMIQSTDNEKKALIILFKDFTSYYNANSLSKEIGISRIGAMKLLKKLENNRIIAGKIIGKSRVYRVNLRDDYVRDLMSFLLSNEANNFNRWKNEFKELFKDGRIIMLYGSAIIDYSIAKDIDLMVIKEEKESGEIQKIIYKKQKILPKKIHLISLNTEEFFKNLTDKQKAIIDIVKKAVILYGQKNYVEIIKNVTSI